MNRKEFFKKLGLGALVVAVAPKVLAQDNESHLLTVSRTPDKEDTFKDGLLTNEEGIPYKCYNSYDNGFEFWHDFQSYNTGVLKIIRNGFYTYNDLFSCNGKTYIISRMDKHFYYAYPL